MDYRIQTIVFPTEDVHLMCRNLFYNGENGFLHLNGGRVDLSSGQQIDFCTYLNSCSWTKWKEYTCAESVSLHLEVEGPVRLRYVGFRLEYWELVRTFYGDRKDPETGKRVISFTFPDNDDTILGVEISAMGDCTVHGGYYTVSVPEDGLNDVTLSIATTTCRKEDYIRKNVQLIKDKLLAEDEELRERLFVHVTDNGNTLKPEEIEGHHVFLHPNPNTGGSGGYARGMIETLHQTPEATHALLMDDDVLVLPESIRRTFKLLRIAKPEYRDHFISGAMLRLEKPAFQHEDIGTIRADGVYESLKPGYHMVDLYSVLKCAGSYFQAPRQYAGWWYCCIPVSKIRENGLPLPLFIRGDDSEYSIRCDAKIMTMNGICIWHQGFDLKYNASMDLYQMARNLLIMRATCGKLDDVDFLGHYKAQLMESVQKFAYNEVELLIKAFEDYMKGPEFLISCNGEKMLKENAAMNEKLEPLTNYPEIRIREIADIFGDEPEKKWYGFFRKATRNGNRWTPSFLYRKGCPAAVYGWHFCRNKVTARKEYAAVNPFEEKVVIRRLDKVRYRQLMKRYRRFLKDYKSRGDEVARAWRESQSRLTSEEFWRSYLGLD